MDNLSILTYTHSNCSDIHEMYFDSFEKYFTNTNHNVLINQSINDSRINQIIYDDNLDYYEQMLSALSMIKSDYLIYSQEDYILYDYVNTELLDEYIKLLDTDKTIMFIRLINAGLKGDEQNYNDDFVIIDNNNEYFFSTQVTIWRKDILEKMFNIAKSKYISDEPKNSPYLKSLNGIGLCTKLIGERVGGHFNSIIYPYTAVAVLRGMWNFSEYGFILNKLLLDYNIDKNKRGII